MMLYWDSRITIFIFFLQKKSKEEDFHLVAQEKKFEKLQKHLDKALQVRRCK